MNQNFDKTNNGVSAKIFAFLLVVVLLVSTVCIGVLTGGFKDWSEFADFKQSQDAEKIPDDPGENSAVASIRSLSLNMSAETTMAADQSISKTLTATVFPEDAKNKELDWKLEWMDEKNQTDISEFLVLTPDSDGSLTATLTCKKPFEGEALITATSREGNVFDTCKAVYVGNPTSLELQPEGFSAESGSIGSYYALGAENSYTFNLLPDNVFGQVGADCNYSYEVTAVGSIKVQDVVYMGNTMTYEWKEGTENLVNISSITTVSKYEPSVFDCTIEGNKLTVKVNCTLESYYQDSVRSGQNVSYTQRFKEYPNDNWYYELKVTETNSGISKSFKFRPVKVVTNVILGDDVVTF